MPDSEHLPNRGGKNWVTQQHGLPEYINRIAKDLMDKGMPESEAIATAVNTVKRWARGGGKVKEDTRVKAAAALAEWESKKAASHVGLSVPARLDPTSRARLPLMDLAAVLDRTAQIVDPDDRAAARLRVLDLASGPAVGGGAVASGRSYSLDELATRRAKFLQRMAAKAKRGKAGSRKAKKRAGAKGSKGAKGKFVAPPKRVKPITAAELPARAKQKQAAASGGTPKWSHGWVPQNDAARAAVKANPQKYAKMRKQQKGAPHSASLSAEPGSTLDLADRPGQRYRHGWIPINSAVGKAIRDTAKPVAKKAAPRVAGKRRGDLVDGLTKAEHRARSERLVQIPRSERTPEQHLAFVRSNAVLRGETPPTKTILQAGGGKPAPGKRIASGDYRDQPTHVLKQIHQDHKSGKQTAQDPALLETILADRAKRTRLDTPAVKALPAGQSAGSTGGMTPEEHKKALGAARAKDAAETNARTGATARNAASSEQRKRLEQTTPLNAQIAGLKDSLGNPAVDRQFDKLHTQRGKILWPELSDEQARHRSVQDYQLRTGAIGVGPNWRRPDWYHGPQPQVYTGPSPHQTSEQKAATSAQTKARLIETAKSGSTPLIRKQAQEMLDKHFPESGSGGSAAPDPAPKPDKPWNEIHRDFKGIHTMPDGTKVRHVLELHPTQGTISRPYRDPKAASPGQAARAAELAKGSTGRHPRADEPSVTPPPARGAHPEKFAPGEKPPVHKFMNTQRLQAIAASTSLDPQDKANAAKAKEILAKRGVATPNPIARRNEEAQAAGKVGAEPPLSNAAKIRNAETMYGTGSPQHLEAQRRFGATPANDRPGSSNARYALESSRRVKYTGKLLPSEPSARRRILNAKARYEALVAKGINLTSLEVTQRDNFAALLKREGYLP